MGGKTRYTWVIVATQMMIIILWGISVSALVRRTWFSNESGMVEISPQKVLGIFLSWTEGADLTILRDGMRVGQLSLITQEEKLYAGQALVVVPETEATEGVLLRELSIAGSMELPAGNRDRPEAGREDELFWRGMVLMDAQQNLPKGEIILRSSRSGWGIQFGFDQRSETISLIVNVGDNELIHYEGSPSGLTKMPELGWTGKLLPLEAVLGAFFKQEGTPPSWAPEIQGKYGSTNIGGRRMLVYQLIVRGNETGNNNGELIKLYLSEAGEPLMVQTAWGYVAMADILVPVELDVEEASKKPSGN